MWFTHWSVATQSFVVAHGSPTAPCVHWKSQGVTSMHVSKPAHGGSQSIDMQMPPVAELVAPVAEELADVVPVDAVDVDPLDVVLDVVPPPAPPLPVPVVKLVPVPLVGV